MKLKLGAENPKKVAVAVVLLLIGLFFVIRGFNSSNGANIASTPPPEQPVMGKRAQLLPENNLDPRLRLDLLKNSEDVEYKGNGRNIFRAGAEPVKELPKPVTPPMKGWGGGKHRAAASAAHQPQVFWVFQAARRREQSISRAGR